MIGADDKQRVIPQVQRLQFIHHLTKIVIAHGDQRLVKLPHLFVVLTAGCTAIIGHPAVKLIAGTAILREVFFRYKERLVRVKTFDLQKPIILMLINLKKVHPCLNSTVRIVIVLCGHCRPVNQILGHPPATSAQGFFIFKPLPGNSRFIDPAYPAVPFLTTNKLKGGVSSMVSGAAVSPVMFVVGHQMSMDPCLTQSLEGREIEWLHWAPAAMQKVIAASM